MIKPTRGYVLIEPEKADEKSAGGFYVPDNAQEKPQKGVVAEVAGDWAELSQYMMNSAQDWIFAHPPCKKGDRVYYKRWAADEIKEDGKEYLIVKFENVLAVIE